MTIETAAVASTPSTPDAGNPTVTDTTAAPAASEPTSAPANTEAQTTEPKATEPQVPEAYEFKMPEGIEVDGDAATEFSAIAKEMKLTQEQAQKVADVGAKMVQRQAEAHARLVESWVETVKADKELGGEKLAENLGIARKALDTFGTPELRDVLNSTGLGNHPAVIKAFYNIGKGISEDKFVSGSPAGGQKDMAKTMFPSMN